MGYVHGGGYLKGTGYGDSGVRDGVGFVKLRGFSSIFDILSPIRARSPVPSHYFNLGDFGGGKLSRDDLQSLDRSDRTAWLLRRT